MSKLLKLKKWLSLLETAKHISGLFDEEVTEADVLRLSLDGHLKLSILFECGEFAKPIDQQQSDNNNIDFGLIDGVWDLPLIGVERTHVIHKMQSLDITGSPYPLTHEDQKYCVSSNSGKIFALCKPPLFSNKAALLKDFPIATVFVVRTDSIFAFEQQVINGQSEAKKPTTETVEYEEISGASFSKLRNAMKTFPIKYAGKSPKPATSPPST